MNLKWQHHIQDMYRQYNLLTGYTSKLQSEVRLFVKLSHIAFPV